MGKPKKGHNRPNHQPSAQASGGTYKVCRPDRVDTPKMIEEQRKLDELLQEQLLFRKKMPKDGSCLFRAVSDQIFKNQSHHVDIRYQCVEYMRRNADAFSPFVNTEEAPFEIYLSSMKLTHTWGSDIEIQALSNIYNAAFIVYKLQGEKLLETTLGQPLNEAARTIRLAFCFGNHYDSIFTMEHYENVVMCQELLFEMIRLTLDISFTETMSQAHYKELDVKEWKSHVDRQDHSDAELARKLYQEDLEQSRKEKKQEEEDMKFAHDMSKITGASAGEKPEADQWKTKGAPKKKSGGPKIQKDIILGKIQNKQKDEVDEDEEFQRALELSLVESSLSIESFPSLPKKEAPKKETDDVTETQKSTESLEFKQVGVHQPAENSDAPVQATELVAEYTDKSDAKAGDSESGVDKDGTLTQTSSPPVAAEPEKPKAVWAHIAAKKPQPPSKPPSLSTPPASMAPNKPPPQAPGDSKPSNHPKDQGKPGERLLHPPPSKDANPTENPGQQLPATQPTGKEKASQGPPSTPKGTGDVGKVMEFKIRQPAVQQANRRR